MNSNIEFEIVKREWNFFFEKSIEIKRKKEDVDSTLNECVTKQMLCKNKLLI